ncbi:MAG TPA: glycerol-3-phosphate acyltransferase [Candidatus Mediterraneibacter surreyensis]|nr:glycerol-3-phosphate acyltransferase [Candidatus Mediterraneibacter surreyensis]
MLRTVLFICMGYLSGSVLYALVFAKIFQKGDILEQSSDHNPGTANAFMYGGFWCGLFTLLFDVLKGFFPVYLFMRYGNAVEAGPFTTALAIAAPVIGHTFPVFYGFRGGKGIAVTFGCLAGLVPALEAFWVLVFFFIGFSTVLQISPHFYRTIFSYAFSLLIMFREIGNPAVVWGFSLITAVVLIRMFTSKEERKCLEVKLLGCSHTLMWDRRRT